MLPSDVVCRTRGVSDPSSLGPLTACGQPTGTEDGSRGVESLHVGDGRDKSSSFSSKVSAHEDIE